MLLYFNNYKKLYHSTLNHTKYRQKSLHMLNKLDQFLNIFPTLLLQYFMILLLYKENYRQLLINICNIITYIQEEYVFLLHNYIHIKS